MGTDVDDATAERLVQALDLNGSFVVGICVSDGSPRGCFRKEKGDQPPKINILEMLWNTLADFQATQIGFYLAKIMGINENWSLSYIGILIVQTRLGNFL